MSEAKDLFEQATRKKYRFNAGNATQYTIEDLWDIPLTSKNGLSLDNIAKQAKRELMADGEESFVTDKSAANETLQRKFDVVLYVISVKKAEVQARALAAEKALKRQQILELLATKETEELAGKSKEDLLKELEAL